MLKFYLPLILSEEQMDFKLSNIPGNSVCINSDVTKINHRDVYKKITQNKKLTKLAIANIIPLHTYYSTRHISWFVTITRDGSVR